MSNKPITNKKAQAILETYGANDAIWPEAVRDDLARLIEHTPSLQALKAREAALDLKLSQVFSAPSSDFLDKTILQMTNQNDDIVLSSRQKIAGFSTLAACVAAGIILSPSLFAFLLHAYSDETTLAMTSLEIWTSLR
jgi:hypothetical protein